MPDAYQAYLQEELRYLEGKIARCRKRLSAITRSEGAPGWELTVLIPRLHNDLLLPLRSLITNAQALPVGRLRSTFITAMEQAGIPESTAKLIDGHARQSLSYGLYSKGPLLESFWEAVDRVEIAIA